MTVQQDWRDEFIATLDHIRGAFDRVVQNSGPTGVLTAPDVHKLSEGLFLSAWTHWEEFVRHLMVLDLANTGGSVLLHEVKDFRYKMSSERLAESILSHPDETKFVEWSKVDDITNRADALLPAGHRFDVLKNTKTSPSTHKESLGFMQRIRNAIAHKSDRAWEKFKALVKAAPFSLTNAQMKGITTGRFLASHSWGSGDCVLREAVDRLKALAHALVP